MKLTPNQAVAVQKTIIDKAWSILQNKRQDYSGVDDPFRNFRMSELAGVETWRGCMVRLMDKLSRIRTIVEAEGTTHVADETLWDTFADAINYVGILAGLVVETLELDIPIVIYDKLSDSTDEVPPLPDPPKPSDVLIP